MAPVAGMLRVMHPLIAGNWKMNLLPSEALEWLSDFTGKLQVVPHDHAEILLNVPATHLIGMAAHLRGSPVKLGGQDISDHEQGAYTGEISGAMLRDAGASYVVVGHSERRAYHQEGDTLINAKVRAALDQGLRPILCIGESAAERDAGRAEEVVMGQLDTNLKQVAIEQSNELVVAYEPIWAIGTGQTATAADAQEMCGRIRGGLQRQFPHEAPEIRILYGGSMKPGNAAELLEQPDINGGLIGGASLEVDALLAILGSAQ